MLDFVKEFEKYIGLINKGHNFSLARYGDGEKMLMCGERVAEGTQARVQDKRKSEGGMTLLGEDLLTTLGNNNKQDYVYAIPCQCCNLNGKNRYLDKLKNEDLISASITYANIFINGNYVKFKEWFMNQKRPYSIIGNYEGGNKVYPGKFENYFGVPDDCVNNYKENHEHYAKTIYNAFKDVKNRLFLFSCGPLANIFIYRAYKTNPHNTYIDVGSALDEFIKGRVTRGFQRPGDYYSNRICVF